MSDTIPPPPDYGEPWEYTSFRNCIRNRHNHTLELQDELRDRARQCVNACAGMADPAKEIQAMRDAIRAAYKGLLTADDDGDYSDHGPNDVTKALAKLQPFITP